MREIVSVQLGGYANYAGAHFWNLQDEALAAAGAAGADLSALPLLRAGAARAAPAPRLQVVDAAGAFGCLSVDAGRVVAGFHGRGAAATAGGASRAAPPAAPPPRDEGVLWGGRTQRIQRDGPALNRYLVSLEEEDEGADGEDDDACMDDADADGTTEDFGLDDNVRYWSDYCKVQFHDRTCFRLPGVHAGVDAFMTYDAGLDAASPATLDDAYDDLRFFIEECESLGGLSFCVDASSGFAGFGDRYLALLRDELGSSVPAIVFGATAPPSSAPAADPATRQRMLRQTRLNEATLVGALRDLRAQYIPLSARAAARMPLLHAMPESPFQTSAVLGAAMDLALTPLRKLSDPASMAALVRALQPGPFAGVSGVAVALPVVEKIAFARSAVLEVAGMARMASVDMAAAAVTRTRRPRSGSAPLRQTRLASEVVVGRGVGHAFDSACALDSRVAIPVPFPRFFDRRLDISGRLRPAGHETAADSAGAGLQEVGELSALASVYTDCVEGAFLLHGYGAVLASEAKRGVQGQGSTEMATLSEAAEALEGMASDYENELSRTSDV